MPVPPNPLEGWRHQLPNHPTSPLPLGQSDGSHPTQDAPSPSTLVTSPPTARIVTLIPRTLNPLNPAPAPAPAPRRASDPLNLYSPNYGWLELSNIDREILRPHRSQA
ncbi:uncharacterized protein ARMOST_06966 [Armillaria ostoyae]|uniref:Uncharacterized protein n=1 Tax=Armillaria ostoyae TaxID=47428 RepID=A0A284R4G2_ARMOS|nr:uncharacterized protein ARMOST_06966 [Armillaria ostoyae]